MTHIVTAKLDSYIPGYDGDTVRVRVPESLYLDVHADWSCAGQIRTGWHIIGRHYGSKWQVIKVNSDWVQRDGSREGIIYVAKLIEDTDNE